MTPELVILSSIWHDMNRFQWAHINECGNQRSCSWSFDRLWLKTRTISTYCRFDELLNAGDLSVNHAFGEADNSYREKVVSFPADSLPLPTSCSSPTAPPAPGAGESGASQRHRLWGIYCQSHRLIYSLLFLLLFHMTSENHYLTQDRDKIETCQRKAGLGSADFPSSYNSTTELSRTEPREQIPTPSPGIGIYGVDSKSRFWSNIFDSRVWSCLIATQYF